MNNPRPEPTTPAPAQRVDVWEQPPAETITTVADDVLAPVPAVPHTRAAAGEVAVATEQALSPLDRYEALDRELPGTYEEDGLSPVQAALQEADSGDDELMRAKLIGWGSVTIMAICTGLFYLTQAWGLIVPILIAVPFALWSSWRAKQILRSRIDPDVAAYIDATNAEDRAWRR